MFNKFELIGAGASIFFMALALYLVQVKTVLFQSSQEAQYAQVIKAKPGLIIVDQANNINQARADAYQQAVDTNGNFKSMVIDDVKIGVGEAVQAGDVVSVHYIGTLQGGKEFDNSHKRGSTFDFKVGAGQVIKGWDEGLVGMKVGGHRMLVIPPEMAYGAQGVGPIPADATLIFSIELVEINQ